MKTPPALYMFLLILLISTTTKMSHASKHDLVKKSCVHASYPDVCIRTLSSYTPSASTPSALAQAAVHVTLKHARAASNFFTHLNINGKREQGALHDCIEQMGDSVDELSKTLAALRRLRRGTGGDFKWEMSNAETWVSAALTNEDTCLDGFVEIGNVVRSDVRRRIVNLGRVTSNALYLINLLDHQNDHHGSPRAHNIRP